MIVIWKCLRILNSELRPGASLSSVAQVQILLEVWPALYRTSELPQSLKKSSKPQFVLHILLDNNFFSFLPGASSSVAQVQTLLEVWLAQYRMLEPPPSSKKSSASRCFIYEIGHLYLFQLRGKLKRGSGADIAGGLAGAFSNAGASAVIKDIEYVVLV